MITGVDTEPAAADDIAVATVSAATVPLRHFSAVGCAVWALLVLAGSASCVADFHRLPGHFDLTELRRNIVEGLQLNRIPDVTKVGDILYHETVNNSNANVCTVLGDMYLPKHTNLIKTCIFVIVIAMNYIKKKKNKKTEFYYLYYLRRYYEY